MIKLLVWACFFSCIYGDTINSEGAVAACLICTRSGVHGRPSVTPAAGMEARVLVNYYVNSAFGAKIQNTDL